MNDALKSYTLSLGAVLLTLALLKLGAGILIPLATALVVWFVIEAFAGVFERLGWPEWLRTLCATLGMLAVIATILTVVTENIAGVIGNLPRYEARIDEIAQELQTELPFDASFTLGDLIAIGDVQAVFQRIAAGLATFLGDVGLVIGYVLFLYFSQQTFGQRLERAIENRDKLAHARALIARAQGQIKSYLWAKFLMSALTGLCSAGVLWLTDVNYPLFWAFWIFLLNFVPYLGSALGVALPTLLAIVQFETIGAVILLFVGLTLIQLTIDNIVEPHFMGKTLNIDPLVVIVALVLWGYLWGMMGIFLAIPLTAILIFLFYQFSGTRWVAILLSRDGELDKLS